MILIKQFALSIPILSLQSASLPQALLFTILELSYLSFVILCQITHKALSSKSEFSIRLLESVTLSFFGIVCILYSIQSETTDTFGRYVSYPTFVLFVFTMVLEYIQLGSKLFIALKEYIGSGQEANRKEREKEKRLKEEKENETNRKIISERTTRITGRKSDKTKKIESKGIEYWRAHPFIALKIVSVTSNSRNLQSSLNRINRTNRNRRCKLKGPRTRNTRKNPPRSRFLKK